MTFRLRLLLASLATIAVGVGALLVLGNVLLAQRVRSEASTVMRANAEAQVSALAVNADGVTVRETVNDATLDRRSWVLEGARVVERPAGVDAALDARAVELGRQARTVEVDGPEDTRIRVQPLRSPGSLRVVGAVVVAYSMESLEHLQHAVLAGSLIVALLVLLAGGLAIRSAVDGALRPVAQMTEDAQDWGAHDLDRRFDLGPPKDELTALAATLDSLHARIAASRRHEQRFASEMAHELRTPLAGLRARAELALRATGDGAEAERREALEVVLAQATRLSDAIDTLMAVARQELDPTSGSVDLAQLAAEVDNVVVRGELHLPRAEGDAEVVRRALAPLVDNARRHARGDVVLELSATASRVCVTVIDDGPGVDPELGERIFDPGVRGDESEAGGAGLGLPLARRLARSCGGDVRLEPSAGGRFVLELPALGL